MVGILGIEYALPEKLLTNEELSALYSSWTPEKIQKKTGIQQRHVTDENETALDLGVEAAEKLLASGIINREEIDFLIFVTQSPDYKLPTTACLAQEQLRLKKSTGAFDLNLGCSGYVYGLAVAKSLVESGIANNVLLITSETYSRLVNPMDKSTRTIFGDGAAATLIGHGGMKICGFDLGTDGAGKDLLIVPAGGARTPCSAETGVETETEGNIRSQDNLFMNGTGIFEFTLREVPGSVNRLLEKENLSKDAIDVFLFHQANKFMLDFLIKMMKLDAAKCYMDFADTGNTVSASIPIAFKRAMENGVVKNQQTLVLSGFGVGLSWGSVLIRT